MAVRRATHQTHTAAADSFAPTPPTAAADFKSRFEAYNRLQAAAFAFGEKLPIPEIVAVGGQSDGKSSLLEALLGFRFNVREVEMGTRRPLVLQMVQDPSSLEPDAAFRFLPFVLDEDSEDYGSPVVFGTAIADLIRSRTDAHLKKIKAAVSSKPIVMRAEYAHCPNLTIIDTPGFVLKAKKGEPENTPDEILSMVKSLASPPHRLLLFLQQSSVEWCSSLWLDSIKEIDPTFKRTIIVVSKFDNRLKEFSEGWEVDRYLSASGYLGENMRPFFVALPKDRGMVTNEDFRRQISQVDVDILHHLRENVKGGFNEEKFEPFIGFSCLRKFLECELQKRYKDAAPATLALLEQRCGEISEELGRIEHKLQATSDVSHLRKSAMLHAASICTHVGSLIDGAADPAPEQWGKTTIEEQEESGFGSWPGVSMAIKPANSDLRLYGGAAFERVMYEFHCATYSIECPPVSRGKSIMIQVANILLAHAGRGGGGGLVEAAAEIARAAARAWLAPILETACERLAFVLKSLFDLAVERNHNHDSDFWQIKGDMDGYVGFHASLRRSYNSFVNVLSEHCKQLVHHHLDSVTSPYSQACYDSDFHGSNSYSRCNQIQSISYFLDMSESTRAQEDMDQENIPPKDQENTTPGKKPEPVKAYRESDDNTRDTVPGFTERSYFRSSKERQCELHGYCRTKTPGEICSRWRRHFRCCQEP
ncbi:Dynamin-related protein 5A [Platanthera guangdongensis]|uniref:Dynamin-related protein 5A n=1 Tax=Platanthera guangdongensis TaxID=2320717 RepID=A0ABR2N1A6_9ASPA